MNLRKKIQDGCGRGVATIAMPILVAWSCYHWWPTDPTVQEKLLNGIQKIAFVSAAFAVTAYNLRTRVVDFVLRVEARPARMDEFCRIARACGRRLTNLVILFTVTSVWLGGLTILTQGTFIAGIAVCGALALFSASVVSFLYIVFSMPIRLLDKAKYPHNLWPRISFIETAPQWVVGLHNFVNEPDRHGFFIRAVGTLRT